VCDAECLLTLFPVHESQIQDGPSSDANLTLVCSFAPELQQQQLSSFNSTPSNIEDGPE
jgi:hypothetical protein